MAIMSQSFPYRFTSPSELLGVDVRSLAAFRIGAATVVLTDIWYRSHEMTAYFTDAGFLPRSARIELYDIDDRFGFAYQWSLHMLSGQAWAQWLLLGLLAMFAVGLLIGYRTRLCAVATWLLLLSLDSRNPMILNSGDVLLRCMLFWSLFLPLGACFSVDRALRPKSSAPIPQTVFSAASVALLLQLGMMYFFSALFKTHSAWLSDKSAVYYALNCDAYVTGLGIRLREFPRLMEFLTVSTYFLELVGPLIVFFPFFTSSIRMGTVLAFWGLHAGLAATMTIGLFPAICIVAWLVYLPPAFWNGWQQRLSGTRWSRRARRMAAWIRLRTSSRRFRFFRHPEVPRWRQSALLNIGLLLLLVYTILWNVRELDWSYWESRVMPRRFNGVGRVLGLDQNWAMFSPIPRTEDGWLVMKGELRDGSEVNLWQPDRPLPWDKPENVSGTYLTQRWRKCLDNLTTEAYGRHRMYFADWLQSRWNREQADGNRDREVVQVQLVHRIELTPPPGKPIPDPESRILWTWYYE